MKKHLLKTMLIATGLIVGAASSWADNVITTLPVTEDFENGTGIFSGGVINSTIGNVLSVYNTTATATFDTDSNTDGNQPYTIKSNEKVTIKYTAYHGYMGGNNEYNSTVTIKNSAGKEILSYKYSTVSCKIVDVAIGGTTVSGFSEFSCQSYFNDKGSANGFVGNGKPFLSGTENNTNITITISGNGLVSINFLCTKKNINNTFSALLGDDFTKDIATITITNNVNNEDRGYGIDNLSISSEVTAETSATYTIKKVCGETTLAETVTTGTIGEKPEISTDNFLTSDGKKYIYVSNNVETVGTIAESSVYTITYREAETYNYTINCIAGSTTKEIKGSAYEGETVNVGFPYLLLSNGKLYKSDKEQLSSDKKGYQLSFNLTSDNYTKDITFAETNINNVQYFSEAEDIEGLTKATNSNTAIRSSCGGSAYAKDNNVEITKLPAGRYKISACFCDVTSNQGTEWNFLAGEKNVFTFKTTAVNWQEGTSEEFTLTEETSIIYLAKGGTNNTAVDFIYIQKTGDIEAPAVGSEEYATYVTTSAVVIPENVKVYAVKAGTTGITKTQVAAGTIVKKGTALLINASEGSYAFTVSTEEGTEPENNDLKAGADAAVEGSVYCLTKNSEGKIGFAKVQSSVEIPSGKAYLIVPQDASANFFALDDTVTAIQSIEATPAADNAYYTLQGVKVEKPTKGIYVHNGKKVVIK